MRFRGIFVFLVLGACCVAGACALNPATGRRQLSLVGEQQEVAIGRENDQAITAQLGLYDDQALQDYVSRLGHLLAAKSERPELPWTFRVVDDPVVNAFALPGGFVYITRGILAHFNNEAELISVLGHEIGHVTARHSVNQMSKAQLLQLGLGVGSVVAPDTMNQLGQLADVGLGLLFLKFGRDDERQADDLGLRYLVAAGYDARPMADVFDTLGRVSAAAGAGGIPGWMSTHPLPENREERINAQIAERGLNVPGRPTNELEFLRKIENIVFGGNPREGYFVDHVFYQPEMRFRLEFPEGWQHQNQRQAVLAASPEQDAIVALTLAQQDSPQAALQQFFSEEGITRTADWTRNVGGFPTAGASFSVAAQQGTILGTVVFISYENRVFRVLAYTPEDRWSTFRGALTHTLESFARVTDRRYLDVEPKRLRVIRLTDPLSLEEFGRRYRSSVPIETLSLINRVDADARLQPGNSYKVVVGGVLPN